MSLCSFPLRLRIQAGHKRNLGNLWQAEESSGRYAPEVGLGQQVGQQPVHAGSAPLAHLGGLGAGRAHSIPTARGVSSSLSESWAGCTCASVIMGVHLSCGPSVLSSSEAARVRCKFQFVLALPHVTSNLTPRAQALPTCRKLQAQHQTQRRQPCIDFSTSSHTG